MFLSRPSHPAIGSTTDISELLRIMWGVTAHKYSRICLISNMWGNVVKMPILPPNAHQLSHQRRGGGGLKFFRLHNFFTSDLNTSITPPPPPQHWKLFMENLEKEFLTSH